MTEEQKIDLQSQPSKPKKFFVVFILIILIVFGFIWAYENYLSPQAKLQKEQKQNYEKYLAWKQNYEKAMTEDTYGGKTPEETLQMFIDALKKGDVELASKYFVLGEDGKPDAKLKNALINAEQNNKINNVIEIISKAKLDKSHLNEEYAWFTVDNNKGIAEYTIILKFNNLAKIWKIESL